MALSGKISAGTVRILAATVSFDGRRWYCAFTVEAGHEPEHPAHIGMDRAHPVVGVDAGVRDLLVVAAPGGAEVARVGAPRALAAAQARLRALQRRAARQDGPDRRAGRRGSKRWQRTAERTGRLHARAANLRRDALHRGHHPPRAAPRRDRDRGSECGRDDAAQARRRARAGGA